MKQIKMICCGFLFATLTASAADVAPLEYYGEIAQRLTIMLPRRHVLQQPFDDVISRRAWTNLVTFYDFDRSVFLKSDLEKLATHELTLDNELKKGDVSFGYEIHALYCRRLTERIAFVTNLLATATWDFSSNETYRVKRKTAEWPATREEAEEHWRKRLKYEMLAQIVNRELDAESAREKGEGVRDKGDVVSTNVVAAATTNVVAAVTTNVVEATTNVVADVAKEAPAKDTPAENLIKKYRQYVTVFTEPDEEAVMQHYMSAVCRAYDPHTDYLSPTTKEDFDIDMNLTLCGVGAVLSMDDGALKIVEVMPGGPMDRDGHIKKGDKIVGVAQEDKALEDVMWQPMKKSIKKIRGPKGTRVTLEIIPRSDPSGTVRKRYELVRDEIKLEDQAATGRVETVTLNGFTNKLGYVYLPGFYGTMDKQPGEEGFRSCAEDIATYLAEFNAQDVEGLVLDLRDDGGGSLLEAVRLSALFVPSGPVVQILDTRRVSLLPIPHNNPVAFRKPIVVLCNRASASASEIVAGHLKDTGRAIVLGDVRTHGKGTVQSVLPMGPEKFGSMKITTARFYRVDGRSTQVEGIESDIHLPSLLDSLDIGEDKLDNALPFSRIAKAPFTKCWNLETYLPTLKAASEARLKDNERYANHVKHVLGMKEISEREEVPLAYDAFKAQARADRALREADSSDDKDDLDEDETDDPEEVATRRPRNQRPEDDVVLTEAFNVLSDLIRHTKGENLPKPPPTALDWYNAILGF